MKIIKEVDAMAGLVCTRKEVCKVLIVEDTEDDLILLQAYVAIRGQGGFLVTHVSRKGEAVNLIKDGHIYDVILLDLTLPDVSRSDRLSGLREIVMLAPRVPVVVTTSLAHEELAMEAIDIGAIDYLIKTDLTDRALVRAMRYAVALMRYRSRLLDQCQELEMAAQDLRVRLEGLKPLTNEDPNKQPIDAILEVADGIEQRVKSMRAA